MSGRGSQAPTQYVMQEWGKNCVMFALSKVLSENVHALARRIVDNRIGDVTMIKQMENGSVVKKVLAGLGFVALHEGALKWSDMKGLVLSHGMRTDKTGKPVLEVIGTGKSGRPIKSAQLTRYFYCVFWRRGKEDWTDKDTPIGLSDHAFTMIVNGPTIIIPPTNDRDFDTSHNPLQDGDLVSVFKLV